MQTLVQNLDNFIDKVRRGDDNVLLPRQFETIQKIRDFLAAGYIDGHVIMPTGIGKTVIFSKFVEAALNGSGGKALIVGPTKIILHQNQGKLGAFADINAGRYFHGDKDLSKQVTVTTYHSLRNLIGNGIIDPKSYQIVILDEAHCALGPQTISAVESFEDAIKIGFTATPEYHEEKSVNDILPFTIDEMSVREGIESNLLAGLRVLIAKTSTKADKIALEGRNFEEESLTKTINTPKRNEFVVSLYKDPRFFGKRAITYGGSCAHAKDLFEKYMERDIPAAYIDGSTSESEREDLFAAFKEGKTVKVLCNAEVLIQGFDETEAEVCFNAAPTLSKVVAEQRGGRVLRRSRVMDNKIGYIVEILDDFGNASSRPILFSEIAGAAEILSPSNQEERKLRKKPGPKIKRTKPSTPRPSKIIEDSDVVMQLTNRNKHLRFTKMFEFAPRGWAYARRLASELHLKESLVRTFAERYYSQNPDWFKRYLTPTDILVTHYHPKLVNLVRRNFVSRLQQMITPDEFAEQTVLTETEAEKLLEAADESADSKAIRFGDTSYFDVEEHKKIILDERKRAKQEDEAIQDEAEDKFWADDDKTDDEHEMEYWETFEKALESIEEEPEEIEGTPEEPVLVTLDDNTYMSPEGWKLEHSATALKKVLNRVFQTVEPRQREIARAFIFEDKTWVEIGEQFSVTGSRVTAIWLKTLSELRSFPRVSYFHDLLDFGSEESSEWEVINWERTRDEGALDLIKPIVMAKKLVKLLKKHEEIQEGKHYIATWDREYYQNIVPAFFYSLFPKHKWQIKEFDAMSKDQHRASINGPAYLSKERLEAREKQISEMESLLTNPLVRIITLRPSNKLFWERVKSQTSKDGKIIILYNLDWLRQELKDIRGIDDSIDYFSRVHVDFSVVNQLRQRKLLLEGRKNDLETYLNAVSLHFQV